MSDYKSLTDLASRYTGGMRPAIWNRDGGKGIVADVADQLLTDVNMMDAPWKVSQNIRDFVETLSSSLEPLAQVRNLDPVIPIGRGHRANFFTPKNG